MPTNPNSDPNIGRKLNARYELVKPLGQGAMGRVYGAKDCTLGGVMVAVKFLSQTLLNQRMRDRFEREAKTCAVLGQRSPHIIRVTDYGVDENEVPFYVMEYLDGASLSDIIRHKPLNVRRFLNLSRQICLGLLCAHQGISVNGDIYPIIHRDIKPSNIFIIQDNALGMINGGKSLGEFVKVLDFGIAKTLQSDSQQTNCFMGTLAYSSPEQMEGCELDERSDIYSLGVMMFQMLTGRMPLYADTHTFGGWYKAHRDQMPRSFEKVNPDVQIPKLLAKLVMDCLAKSPDDRPQSVTEIIKTMEVLEERYRRGEEIAKDIGDILKKPVVARPNPDALSPEAICRLQSWPTNKPIAEIVFPHLLETSNKSLATLWVMLHQEVIKTQLTAIAHNKFMFSPSPHPMLLWVTIFYTHSHGPRWLPCYLDLKSHTGQKFIRILSESKCYQVLFFAQEKPQHCTEVLTLSITEPAVFNSPERLEEQSRLLNQFAAMAHSAPASEPKFSKNLLKAELEKIKPKILQKLETLW
ncbi:MAG: serine/threonine-protein kinase [Synechococcales bacterium]|nr:serine/threonine-protein kinase [Synechococcales bacterium]